MNHSPLFPAAPTPFLSRRLPPEAGVSRRNHRAPLLILLVMLVSSACGSDGDRNAYRDDTVTILSLADISKPMPFISETVLDGGVVGQMYMAILWGKWEDGRLHARTADQNALALAKSYEFFGPDSTSLRYHLRGDVRWSDGVPLTAHDAVWTIETRGDPRVASPRRDYNRFIEGVVAEDDSTLVVHFSRRYPEMLAHSATEVAPRHVFEGSDPANLRSHPALTRPEGGNLVVSGPYMIGEWRRGQRVILVPNPEFHPQPNIPRVVFQVIPEETTRLIEFQTGNADVLQLPYDKVDLIQQSVPDMRIEVRRGRLYDYIAYNPLAHPALADPQVRRALGLAIDREGMIRALSMEGFAEPAGSDFSPIQTLHYDPVAQAPLPFDPDEAARILDDRGWIPGPDGIRVKEGRPLRLVLSTNAGNQRRADIGQIVQQAWSRIGVDTQLQTRESNTFFDALNRKEFEAAIAGWSIGLFVDMTSLWDGESLFNFTSFDDPEVSRIMQEAMAQPTEEGAAPYWREAAARIVEEQPYSWLFYMDAPVGVRGRVQDTIIDTLGELQNLHEWRIVPSGGGSESPGATGEVQGGG
jgi:peptide/nickel transport system substrate-binding protein